MLAESFLKHGAATHSGGDRYQIVVHVDAETLKTSTPGRCEHEDGPSLAAETARRMACDCSVVRIVEDPEGNPFSVGRKTRSIPPALRRALSSRDRGCRFPGCTHTRYVDAHHVRHWIHGGETKLSNLATLCRFHHRCVHEGRVGMQILDDGGLRFIQPDGGTFDSPLPILESPGSLLRDDEQLQIRADAAVTRWRGEKLDAGWAVEALLQRSGNSGRKALGT